MWLTVNFGRDFISSLICCYSVDILAVVKDDSELFSEQIQNKWGVSKRFSCKIWAGETYNSNYMLPTLGQFWEIIIF